MKIFAEYLQTPGIGTLTMRKDQAERLARKLAPLGWEVLHCETEAQFLSALPQATAVATWHFRQEWFALAPHLRLVSTPAAGKDYFSVQWPKGIQHWNGTFHGTLMAESAVAMILAMQRGLLQSVTTYAREPWPRTQIDAICRPLRGSLVTICGFGHIGRAIGRLLKPFGVRICGVSQHDGHSTPDYFEKGDECRSVAYLEEILPVTDVLVLVLPRTPETDGFLSRARLALLPHHAYLCNLGRGNAVDEEALVTALRNGKLAGAVLDVVQQEPLPEHSPLRTCPNLWLTPHSSAFSQGYMDLYADELAERLTSFPCLTALFS